MLARWIAVWCLLFTLPSGMAAAEWSVTLTYPRAVRETAYSGRVYLFFSTRMGEPRRGPDWLKPEPFVALDVQNWQPETPLTLHPQTPGLLTFPKMFALSAGEWKVQGVARFNPEDANVGTGAGNAYSEVVPCPTTTGSAAIALSLASLVPERTFRETTWSKLCEVESTRLSQFYGRPMHVRGGVLLPRSYHNEPERRYPVIFSISGFGGAHFGAERDEPMEETNAEGVEFIRVMLDPRCGWGHHVFADSATNGPRGTSLVQEWLPEFERRYRTAPRARYLTGHSSGGWSSLWLQVTYPEVFDGVWSTAPDPVDFRDFQQANIYRAGENAWVDPQGQRRPIARRNGQPVVWWDDFDQMERVLGHGGQFRSFDAVFGPRGADGQPQLLWNPVTGIIDPTVAEAWRAYDLRLQLEQQWPMKREQLAGKLHVFMGAEDTFYLTGATELLQTALRDLGSDAVVEIQPGKDHSSLITTELRDRIRSEMTQRFLSTRER